MMNEIPDSGCAPHHGLDGARHGTLLRRSARETPETNLTSVIRRRLDPTTVTRGSRRIYKR
jgi:hypothetical protein